MAKDKAAGGHVVIKEKSNKMISGLGVYIYEFDFKLREFKERQETVLHTFTLKNY